MKRAIVCLLIVFLVFSALSLISVPQAASQPQPDSNIKVVNYNWYLDSYGYLDAVGEIQNTGTDTYSNVTLIGILSTADGSAAESYGMVWVTDLLPNQKAPFYMQFDATNTFYGTFIGVEISKIDFTAYPSEKTNNYLYPDVSVSNSNGWVDTDGSFYVSGTVKNTGTKDAKNVFIAVTFYNSEGKIAGVGVTNNPITPNPILPGSTADFKVGAWDLNQSSVEAQYKISSYSVLVQVSGTVLQGDAPAVTPNPTSGPITSGNPNSQATGTPGSDSGFNTDLVVAAVAVVVVVVVVLALLRFKKPKTGSAQKNSPGKTAKKAAKRKK
jgi:hypothetical protein